MEKFIMNYTRKIARTEKDDNRAAITLQETQKKGEDDGGSDNLVSIFIKLSPERRAMCPRAVWF